MISAGIEVDPPPSQVKAPRTPFQDDMTVHYMSSNHLRVCTDRPCFASSSGVLPVDNFRALSSMHIDYSWLLGCALLDFRTPMSTTCKPLERLIMSHVALLKTCWIFPPDEWSLDSTQQDLRIMLVSHYGRSGVRLYCLDVELRFWFWVLTATWTWNVLKITNIDGYLSRATHHESFGNIFLGTKLSSMELIVTWRFYLVRPCILMAFRCLVFGRSLAWLLLVFLAQLWSHSLVPFSSCGFWMPKPSPFILCGRNGLTLYLPTACSLLRQFMEDNSSSVFDGLDGGNTWTKNSAESFLFYLFEQYWLERGVGEGKAPWVFYFKYLAGYMTLICLHISCSIARHRRHPCAIFLCRIQCS